jgi:hypothetical protein
MSMGRRVMQLAATRLSCSSAARACQQALSRLARLSLLGLAVPMLSACLVDDPPPYIQPKRTPPRLDYHQASPLLDQVIVAVTGDLLVFTIPVASEDAGEGLTVQFFLDSSLADYQTFPPSTLEDRSRVARFSIMVGTGLKAGCHLFKLRVGHASTLPNGNGPSLDPTDLAEAYWWANLNLPSDQAGMLTNCPSQGPVSEP